MLPSKQTRVACDEMGTVEGTKGSGRSFIRETGEQEGGEISASDVTRFHALLAIANYLAADRPDTRSGVKEIFHEMAAPTMSSVARVQRLAPYLTEVSPLVWENGSRGQGGRGRDPRLRGQCLGGLPPPPPHTRRSAGLGLLILHGAPAKQPSATRWRCRAARQHIAASCAPR